MAAAASRGLLQAAGPSAAAATGAALYRRALRVCRRFPVEQLRRPLERTVRDAARLAQLPPVSGQVETPLPPAEGAVAALEQLARLPVEDLHALLQITPASHPRPRGRTSP